MSATAASDPSALADRILAEHARDVANTVGLGMSTTEALALRRRFEARLETLESIEAPNAALFRRAHNAASLRRLAEPAPDALHGAINVRVSGNDR